MIKRQIKDVISILSNVKNLETFSLTIPKLQDIDEHIETLHLSSIQVAQLKSFKFRVASYDYSPSEIELENSFSNYNKLWEEIKMMEHLQVLDLKFFPQTKVDERFSVLAMSLNKLICLQELVLHLNLKDFSEALIIPLFQTLKNLSNIENLDLNLINTNISDYGLQILNKSLCQLRKLCCCKIEFFLDIIKPINLPFKHKISKTFFKKFVEDFNHLNYLKFLSIKIDASYNIISHSDKFRVKLPYHQVQIITKSYL